EVVAGEMTAAAARDWAEANVRDAGNLPDCRVSGWAGGFRSEYPPRGLRVATPLASHLMQGDIVVVCPEITRPENFAVWAKGENGLEVKTADGARPVLDQEVVAILTNDFFTALRPVRMHSAQKDRTGERDNAKR
ncbi:MAG: hypothetical protein J6R18_08530, partial [Kiritimatiellae bacterium]|nr:hypothetical protein [Kiritimatiellia bacterium]